MNIKLRFMKINLRFMNINLRFPAFAVMSALMYVVSAAGLETTAKGVHVRLSLIYVLPEIDTARIQLNEDAVDHRGPGEKTNVRPVALSPIYLLLEKDTLV
jgi:hypothetical protein